ncbi:hypothetical protein FPOAC2_07438 [Fusarium poae]
MALNRPSMIGPDGRCDYSTPGSHGYSIPNTTYGDASNRRLKVVTIGAGFSGILLAYELQKKCQNVEHVIYEKNHEIGGTWLENRYPNCACDVPSHGYTYNFALNPDWPRFFSYSQDIWEYLNKVTHTFGLRKYMTFNTEVVGAVFDESRGKWRLKIRCNIPQTGKFDPTKESEGEIFYDECDLLLYATGMLNKFKWPEITGLERFKGRLVHTAHWPKDYQAEQWKQDRVAVIGSGASSVQTVPGMQPYVKHMDVFVRTGVWFVQIANNFGANHEYTDEQKREFKEHPEKLVAHAKDIENQINNMWGVFYTSSERQESTRELSRQRMAEFIKDERLLKGFTPKFELGCRRVTPGDPYMHAIQEPNVDVHFTHAQTVTEDGIIGGDGVERKCDTIVCATGLDVSYRPRFPVIGLNGVDLGKKWENAPEGYLGLGSADMPNFIIFVGPTWPVANGSISGGVQAVANYAVQIVHKMQKDNIKYWAPKQHVVDQFNDHAQEWYKHTVWKDSCRSWYKNNNTGRINAVWPGSSLHYIDVISVPRYEDFIIQYHNNNNMWAFLGMGYSLNNINENFSPTINIESLDDKWLEAAGVKVPELLKNKKAIKDEISELTSSIKVERSKVIATA